MANSKDVAARAGTSQSTVSRVFRGHPGVDAGARRRVLQSAQELNYAPNQAAQALTSGKTRRIALVVESLRHPAFALIADLVHQELLKRDFKLHIVESDLPRGELQESSLQLLNSADGIIVGSASRDFSALEGLRNSNKPVIFALRAGWPLIEDASAEAVVPDHEQAAEVAVEHLWGLGHRNIAFLSATDRYTAGFETALKFQQAMERRGAPGQHIRICQGPMGYHSGFSQTQQLLDSQTPPTAIFTPDDLSAYGAIDAVRDAGLVVPDDVSIIGFDDLEMSSWRAYELTTVAIPFQELVETTIEKLFHHINLTGQEENDDPVVLIKGSLIQRTSTGPVRHTSVRN